MRWRAALILFALAAGILPIPRQAVERLFSTSVYPHIQRLFTTTSNLVPFAWLDGLLIAGPIWLAVQLVRDRSKRGGPSWYVVLLRSLGRLVTAAAALYLGFLALWGLNYRRVPLVEKLQFDQARVSTAGALTLAAEVVGRLNDLYQPAHATGWAASAGIDPVLVDAFLAVQRDLEPQVAAAVPARPKRSILDLYFRRTGVAGMTDPYMLETLVVSDLLSFERPFVVAHEWNHLAGIADEGEANFAGFLTCMRGSTSHEYSAWLFLYGELGGVFRDVPGQSVASRLDSGPREDLAAIRDRLRREVSPRLSAAGWQIYDRYLKANRVEQGAASYAEVVRLLLGVRFASHWAPIRRG